MMLLCLSNFSCTRFCSTAIGFCLRLWEHMYCISVTSIYHCIYFVKKSRQVVMIMLEFSDVILNNEN